MEIKVELKGKVEEIKVRIEHGFTVAGAAWKAANQKYPARGAGSMRTGALGNTAAFEVGGDGHSMTLLARKYWKFLMYGTGIHGPFMQPIVPVRARVLAWRSKSGMVFAKSSSGTIWPGQLDKVEHAVVEGFRRGVKEGGNDRG